MRMRMAGRAKKRILISVLCVVSGMMMAQANPLESYRWKNRLLVVWLPDGKAGRESERETEMALAKARGGVSDRDLVVIDLGSGGNRIDGAVLLSGEASAAVRERLRVGTAGKAEFVLIGKDGGVKGRQSGALDLGKFFALVDTMPMRKEEVRRKGGRS